MLLLLREACFTITLIPFNKESILGRGLVLGTAVSPIAYLLQDQLGVVQSVCHIHHL